MVLKALVNDFQNRDLQKLQPYHDLISTKDDSGVFPPYVPFVGENYDRFKLFIYAKAQNIGLNGGYLLNSSPEQKVRRLCDAKTYRDVAIAPYNSGVLPGLIGIFLYAKFQLKLHGFDEIQRHLAVTNYYKFSLNKNGRDLNPENLGKYADATPYYELNNRLCQYELEFLKPTIIISFRGRHNGFLRAIGYNVIEIADPAFILRGGWGRFRKGGSYYEAANRVTDPTAVELAIAYSEKCEGKYRAANKLEAVRIYLLKYYNDWQV